MGVALGVFTGAELAAGNEAVSAVPLHNVGIFSISHSAHHHWL